MANTKPTKNPVATPIFVLNKTLLGDIGVYKRFDNIRHKISCLQIIHKSTYIPNDFFFLCCFIRPDFQMYEESTISCKPPEFKYFKNVHYKREISVIVVLNTYALLTD